MVKTTTLLAGLLLHITLLPAQTLENKHNPKIDLNLSPAHNASICPDHNAAINPQSNWNINPQKNGLISPDKVDNINPVKNMDLNPVANIALNPMFVVSMSPKCSRWKGLYLFDKEDELAGYISSYSQELMLEFDKNADWKYFYVKTARGTFNQFDLDGKWTGCYLCFDSMIGYNLFDKQGAWTGMHIK